MYSRQPKHVPGWLIAVAGLLLVFGGYYVWRGVMAFFESNGNIAASATDTFGAKQTASVDAHTSVSAVDFTQPSPLPAATERVCQDFRVSVIRARVRECPKDSCSTISMPSQGTKICVYGSAPQAPDWYEIDISPDEPMPRTGYMHSSVLDAINPTKRPTQTFTPLPTITLVPSSTYTRTPTPTTTRTPNPAAPATWTLTPTPTRVPPVQSA
jgi:hypothetical protein